MADFRPFTALRYDTAVAGDASTLVAPPYDIVSAAEIAALYARSPFNISRVDYGAGRPGDNAGANRYTRAQEELKAWRDKGVLRSDAEPRFYVYDQEFELRGARRRRRSVFGRLRLEEWAKGIVLPHEHTGALAKADRLRLLRATRVNLSPIMALYRNPSASALIANEALGEPVFNAVLPGERHTLRPVALEAAGRFQKALTGDRLYIADGHHRYETALAYRNERRAATGSWMGEEPENFVLAALVDTADPGLVVLPIHRLLGLSPPKKELVSTLQHLFGLEARQAGGRDDLAKLMQALATAGKRGPAFGAIGLEPGKLHLLTIKDRAKVEALVPADHPSAWRALDVAVLHNAVLPAIGFEESPESIAFTEDAEEAAVAVEAGQWDIAFLLNPTRVDQVIAVAEAGERMPQKSTFFYPKLGTGVVTLPLD